MASVCVVWWYHRRTPFSRERKLWDLLNWDNVRFGNVFMKSICIFIFAYALVSYYLIKGACGYIVFDCVWVFVLFCKLQSLCKEMDGKHLIRKCDFWLIRDKGHTFPKIRLSFVLLWIITALNHCTRTLHQSVLCNRSSLSGKAITHRRGTIS